MICKPGLIEQFTTKIKTLYDPIHRIREEYKDDFFGAPE
jgi:hypothetical protein